MNTRILMVLFGAIALPSFAAGTGKPVVRQPGSANAQGIPPIPPLETAISAINPSAGADPVQPQTLEGIPMQDPAMSGRPLPVGAALVKPPDSNPRLVTAAGQLQAAMTVASNGKDDGKGTAEEESQRNARAFGLAASQAGSPADVPTPTGGKPIAVPSDGLPDQRDLKMMINRYAPVDISADISELPSNERQALIRIIEAAKIMNTIFLRQVWSGNEKLQAELMKDQTPWGALRLAYFTRNRGPWDSLDNNKAFVPGAPAQKPPQANFYPDDATKAEVEAWIKTLPAAEQERARGFYTTVRRDGHGQFQLIPYSEEYKAELQEAAGLLNEAAALSAQPTLQGFLRARAKAFMNDDYYASEVAWMDLDASLEPTIGPYEVYQDQWFNYKAAFEADIAVRDDVGSAKLQQFSAHLQELENDLPIPDAMKNPKLGSMAPIRVVNVVFNAGDADHGVQTAAFNLPNDDRVIQEKGSKRVLLKNVQIAKFDKTLVPISKIALSASDQPLVSFDAFFTHILMHELMHGLGPHEIIVNGQKTNVRRELQNSYSAIEEAKADISGLWALQQLIDKGALPRSMEKTMYVTFLASSFRTMRFGLHEAHGKGQALQLNTFLDQGAVVVNKDGTFSVDRAKIKDAVRDLTAQLLIIEGHGDRAAAEKLLAERGVIRPAVRAILDKLKDLPVDIAPNYVTAENLKK